MMSLCICSEESECRLQCTVKVGCPNTLNLDAKLGNNRKF